MVALKLLVSFQSKLNANHKRINTILDSPVLCFSEVHLKEVSVLTDFNSTLSLAIDELSSII